MRKPLGALMLIDTFHEVEIEVTSKTCNTVSVLLTAVHVTVQGGNQDALRPSQQAAEATMRKSLRNLVLMKKCQGDESDLKAPKYKVWF